MAEKNYTEAWGVRWVPEDLKFLEVMATHTGSTVAEIVRTIVHNAIEKMRKGFEE